MKTVFPNDEVFHLWANESQDRATGYGAVSFTGSFAYSYSAVIGRIVRNAAGEKAFLVSTRQHSITTSKHQSYLSRAIPRTATRFAVAELSSYGEFDAPGNLTRMVAELPELAAKANRARSNKPYLLESLAAQVETVKKFAAFFSLPEPELPENFDSLVEAIETARKESAKLAAEVERLADISAREHLQEWLDGGSRAGLQGLKYDYMRLDGEGQIETTRGARVPAEHVKQARPLVLAMIARAKETKQPVIPTRHLKMGFYTLDRIESNGLVKVGCHTFESSEIQRIADLLGN